VTGENADFKRPKSAPARQIARGILPTRVAGEKRKSTYFVVCSFLHPSEENFFSNVLARTRRTPEGEVGPLSGPGSVIEVRDD
jgi:hypothetical protein